MTNWKNKLLAFLHDPPHKPVRINDHEAQRADTAADLALPREAAEVLAGQRDPVDDRVQIGALVRALGLDPERAEIVADIDVAIKAVMMVENESVVARWFELPSEERSDSL